MSKNTAPEMFDEELDAEALTKDEILMSESDLLAGLLELGRSKDDSVYYRKIKIKRNNEVKLEFRIRPITEDESQTCMRRASKYAPAKRGQPKRVTETDHSRYRSYLIYTATVDEDRAKIWDNAKAQEALGVMQGVDMIDTVLLAGEKTRILDVIDEISGFDEEGEELAKN